jgi:hypothetical protein
MDGDVPNFPLYLADGDGQNAALVGYGFFPAWLDEQRYGYVRWPAEMPSLGDVGEWTEEMLPWLETAVLGTEGSTPLLTSAQLLAALPTTEDFMPPEMLIPLLSQLRPTAPNEVLLFGISPLTGDAYLFLLRHAGTPRQELRYLAQTSGWVGEQALFSPDGRYLLLSITPTGNYLYQETILMDVEAGETMTLTTRMGVDPAWSQQGQWLLLDQIDHTLLYAPHSNDYAVATTMHNCETPFWSVK